jgi:F0F1-type ATP synthase assembly protein I
LRKISQALAFVGCRPTGAGDDMVQQRRGEPGQAAAASRYMGIGLTMALATGLFMYAGVRADRWLGTDPWMTLIGAFVGASAGFYYMYHHLVIAPRNRSRSEGRDDV